MGVTVIKLAYVTGQKTALGYEEIWLLSQRLARIDHADETEWHHYEWVCVGVTHNLAEDHGCSECEQHHLFTMGEDELLEEVARGAYRYIVD